MIEEKKEEIRHRLTVGYNTKNIALSQNFNREYISPLYQDSNNIQNESMVAGVMSIFTTLEYGDSPVYVKHAKENFNNLIERNINFEAVRLLATKMELDLVEQIAQETQRQQYLKEDVEQNKSSQYADLYKQRVKESQQKIHRIKDELNIVYNSYDYLEGNLPMNELFDESAEIKRLADKQAEIAKKGGVLADIRAEALERRITRKQKKLEKKLEGMDLETVKEALEDREKIAEVQARIQCVEQGVEFNGHKQHDAVTKMKFDDICLSSMVNKLIAEKKQETAQTL